MVLERSRRSRFDVLFVGRLGEGSMASTSASLGGKAAAGQGLFTRQSSGLVRELGVPAATGIALASVAVVNTFINFNAGLVSFNQADMTLPLLLGAAIWLVAMFAYKYLLEAIPRAGGEYVYLSRIISPALGAMAGISICIAFTYILAANANFTAAYTPFMLTALGAAFNSSAISDAAGNVTSQGAIAAISVVMLLVVGAVSLVSIRRLAQVILALVGIQLLAFLVLGWLLITHSHQDFVNALATFSNHPNAFNDILAAAQKNQIPLGISIGASLTAVPFMVLNYNGVLYAYYVGGELKRPGRTYLYASVISIGLLVVVWLGVWLLMRNTVGLDFMQSQAKLGATDPDAYGKITSLQSSAGGLGYGLILSGDPISKILIGIAVPSAELAVDLAFVAVVTRVMFALAFDRLLPISLAKISERSAIPTNAIIVAVVIGILFAILAAFVNLSNIVANLALFVALIIVAGGVAATALPYRRPDLIMRPGQTELARVGGVPVPSLWGAATTLLAVIVVALIVTHPEVFGSFTLTSVGALVIVLLAGPVIYLIARQMRLSRSSIDLRLAMRELPPE
ncbi:MAG: APC family permease [Chloroflexi bacterium]|nr:MAG: APC family permease [Chloroflexota bacterium]TMF91287.1 MAG: APC family permease [Chloroflexota bacterium]